ncbi:N-lysine methyltransferase SMYD2-B [Lepeophtheirus salmonis]|uniref:N-lysine methyltransferase SMYD2-B n=1 Tax=Lepeophtheirus salmonis TaxID=72036 RepID=UPI001AE75EE0|nr:N-lysine methyltransferase SMYD2-B-like [Lepeophtheirus salmonis]
MVYKKGDQILNCYPFSYAFKEEHRDKICDFCFSSVQAKISRCSKCCVIYYYGRQCQKSSWMETHKHECKFLEMLDSKEPQITLLLIVRTLCKLRNDGGYSKKVSLPNGRSRRFGDLMSHKENVLMDPKLNKMFFVFLTMIRNKLGGVLETNESEVLDIFTKISINSASILNGELLNVGTCLSLEFSSIDHSCRPNALYMFIGRTLVVQALCDIANFEDVRVGYIDTTKPRFNRQILLKNKYFFDCNCEECTEDPLNLEKLKSHSPCCPQCQNLVDGNRCMNCNKEVDLSRYYQIKEILSVEEINAKASLLFKDVLKYFHPFDYVAFIYCHHMLRYSYLLTQNEIQILHERILLALRKYVYAYDILMPQHLINLMVVLISKNELKSLHSLLFETKTAMDVIYPKSHSMFDAFNDVCLMYEMANDK